MTQRKRIYLDYAAAAPIDSRVLRAMMDAAQWFGNPSAFNNSGREAAKLLHAARSRVASFLGARPEEIIFSASGSEANTLAIIGTVRAAGRKGAVAATPVEHLSVLEPIRRLGKEGHRIAILPVDGDGIVSCDAIKRLLKPGILLVSVMYANNEVGAIQPVARIGKTIREFRKKHSSQYPLFHIDACQAAGFLDMNVQRLGCDLLSFNGSKISGPRGVGVLFVRYGTRIEPIILGGLQEYGKRAGTENLQGIVGLSRATEIISVREKRRIMKLRNELIQGIKRILPDAKINGPDGIKRLANNIHISIPGVTSEAMLIELDAVGISAGSGSACTAHSVEPSHVLKAMGVRDPYLSGAIRFSIGRATKRSDILYLLRILPAIIKKLRQRYGRQKELNFTHISDKIY